MRKKTVFYSLQVLECTILAILLYVMNEMYIYYGNFNFIIPVLIALLWEFVSHMTYNYWYKVKCCRNCSEKP